MENLNELLQNKSVSELNDMMKAIENHKVELEKQNRLKEQKELENIKKDLCNVIYNIEDIKILQNIKDIVLERDLEIQSGKSCDKVIFISSDNKYIKNIKIENKQDAMEEFAKTLLNMDLKNSHKLKEKAKEDDMWKIYNVVDYNDLMKGLPIRRIPIIKLSEEKTDKIINKLQEEISEYEKKNNKQLNPIYVDLRNKGVSDEQIAQANISKYL